MNILIKGSYILILFTFVFLIYNIQGQATGDNPKYKDFVSCTKLLNCSRGESVYFEEEEICDARYVMY